MGLAVLIDQGIRALLSDEAFLAAQIGGTPSTSVRIALGQLPMVLSGLNELAWDEDATPRDRAALTVVMAYGLRTENLIPARGERLLLGILDDAYLAFFAASHTHGALPGVSAADIAQALSALSSALPAGVKEDLERQLTVTLDEIEAFAGQVR